MIAGWALSTCTAMYIHTRVVIHDERRHNNNEAKQKMKKRGEITHTHIAHTNTCESTHEGVVSSALHTSHIPSHKPFIPQHNLVLSLCLSRCYIIYIVCCCVWCMQASSSSCWTVSVRLDFVWLCVCSHLNHSIINITKIS